MEHCWIKQRRVPELHEVLMRKPPFWSVRGKSDCQQSVARRMRSSSLYPARSGGQWEVPLAAVTRRAERSESSRTRPKPRC